MNLIEARERVLDLGIGGEPMYTLKDGDKILRVGADIRFDALKTVRSLHPENQVQLDAKDNLPFSAESFDRVQIFYPDGSLLESVCNQAPKKGVKPLWPELRRTLHTGDTVELYLDEFKVLPFSTAFENEYGEIRCIWKPHKKAEKAAKKHGFDVRVEQLSEERLESLENISSLHFARYANQYLVSATKTAEAIR